MRRAPRPKAVRAVEKVLLVDRLEHHGDRALQHLVLEGRDADWPRLRAIALRDVDASHGRRLVACRTSRGRAATEVVLQVRCVLRRRSAGPRPSRRPCACAGTPRCSQSKVDVMRQRRERRLSAHLCASSCYPFEFR